MCTINRRTYSCSVPVENGVCGETKTLDIIHEFKRLYEEKMHEIDNSNCEDCLQEKIKLQQDWIGDLTEQNEMLVRAVEELEQEATERVKMLEEKLQRSAQCISEVMQKYREHDITEIILEESRQRIFNLENDLKNMLELVRRLRDDNELSLGGLTFYDITRKELLGDKTEGCILSDLKKADMTNQEQISAIQSLESKLEDCERITKAKQEECENLQRNMIDMRQALTEEVATKHDAILKLKRECQELEERCIQADKQTAFRDDIIKELRKEIKQLKQQIAQEEVEKLQKTIDELRNTLEESRRLQEVEEKERCSEILELKERIKELEGCLCDANEKVKEEVSKLATLNKKVKELEQCLCDAKEKAKEEVSKIVTLNQTVKELEQCLCDVEEKAKGKESENIALNNKIKELECYLCEANEQIKNDQACKTLRERIKELELALNDAKGKMKVCKLCKHSIRVGFSDNSEVQTDEVNQEQIEKLIERDELIKFQAKTLKMLQQELDNFQKKEKAWLVDKEKSEKNCNEVQCLQKHIVGLNEQLLKFGKKIDELNETVKSKEDFIKTQKEAFNCLEKELDSIKSKETELREESQQQIVGLKEQLLKFEKKVDELNETVKSKEDVIKTQKEALNCVEKELNSIRSKETELREENQQQNASIRKLKCKIKEMETTALDAERRASNLQTAVDLYTNTINVLEGNEEKYKLEIENQRTTIINLQEAIVATKNELDSAKQKYNDSVSVGWTSRWFGLSESKPTDNNQTPVHDI